jgi:anaerobic selenocysteine-containing dehydrogenase
MAGLNIPYHPDRILQPLKRAGLRSSGRFQPISWDEALSMLAEKMKALRDKGAPEKFVFHSSRDITTHEFTRRFCHAFGSPNNLAYGTLGCPNKRAAQELTWGAEVEINDVAHTEYMLNFGSNPYEAHLLRTSFVQRIAEGRTIRIFDQKVHTRAKLVTFDSRLSKTAGRSDEWYPIRPGTDAVVALAIAHVLVNNNLYDREFVERYTNYSLNKLRLHVEEYTPELAERVAGVSARELYRIALEYGSTRPATTISTGGITKHANGVYAERCIMMLNVLTGNIDLKGGYCLPRSFTLKEPGPVPQGPKSKSKLLPTAKFPLGPAGGEAMLYQALAEEEGAAGVYMLYESNPAYAMPEATAVAEYLADEEKVPFIVVCDSFMSETAKLADLILPTASYLERWELETPPAFEMVPFVSLRQPVISPVGKVRPITDILADLASRIGEGMERYFDYGSMENYLEASLVDIDKLTKIGGIDYLTEHGVWFDPEAKPTFQSYKKKGFATPSGKIELYSKRLKEAGFNPLPVYESLESHKGKGERELNLITFQWNVHTHFSTGHLKWLAEIVHSNPLWINPWDAKSRDIDNNDIVRVTSKVGSVICRAMVTEGIRPGAVALSDNLGHSGYSPMARAEAYESKDPDTKLTYWHEDGHGWNAREIIPAEVDPIGGGQAWMDTTVTVAKVASARKKGVWELYKKIIFE